MWERFELFWTAFEKFALFFSFVATLAILTTMVLIYNEAVRLEPLPEPMAVEPVIQTMNDGFVKIQDAVLTTEVWINHTVPITLNIRLNPDRTNLELVEKSEMKTGEITIHLRDEAGTLIGKDATLQVGKGNSFKVKMDLSKQVVFDVPIRVAVPVEVPLRSVNLAPEINALRAMPGTPSAPSGCHVESSRRGRGLQPAGWGRQCNCHPNHAAEARIVSATVSSF